MSCKDVRRCVHAFIHDELEPQQLVEIERHLELCSECRELVGFERWFRLQLQASVGVVTPPAGLAARIERSLVWADRAQRFRRLASGAGLALAVAVGVMAALILPEWLQPRPSAVVSSSMGMGARPLIDYVAERHARRLPVEVMGPDANNVALWFRDKVDFAVHPPLFSGRQVQLVGGRITHVGDRQAAQLAYLFDGRTITVVVVPGGEQDLLLGRATPRQAGGHTVYVGASRGYNVAVWEQGGMSYAVSSDIDQNDMIRLVSSVR